jgi:hypothetical protein
MTKKGINMARTANPYTKVLKHLTKLQAKADKLNAEIVSVTKMISAESAKLSRPKTNPIAKKKSVAKLANATQKARAKTQRANKPSDSKKPRKATTKLVEEASREASIPKNPDGSPNYLALLNSDGVSELPKQRGKKK